MSARDNVHVPNSARRLENGTVNVLITNLTESILRVPKGTRVARFEVIDESLYTVLELREKEDDHGATELQFDEHGNEIPGRLNSMGCRSPVRPHQ